MNICASDNKKTFTRSTLNYNKLDRSALLNKSLLKASINLLPIHDSQRQILLFFLGIYNPKTIENIFPSIETIAQNVGLQRRQTIYNIRALESRGYIRTKKRMWKLEGEPNFKQTSNVYIFQKKIITDGFKEKDKLLKPKRVIFSAASIAPTPPVRLHPNTSDTNKHIMSFNPSPTSPNLITRAEESKNVFKSLEENFTECGDFVPSKTPVKSISLNSGYQDIANPPKELLRPKRNPTVAEYRACYGQALKILGHKYTIAEEAQFYRKAFEKKILPRELEETARLIKGDICLRNTTTTINRLLSVDDIKAAAKGKPAEIYKKFLNVSDRAKYLDALTISYKCTKQEALEYLKRGEAILKKGYIP